MAGKQFKPKAYVKEGCPFSFKFLLFMTESGLLDDIEVIRCDPEKPDFDTIKQQLTRGLKQPATFPTVEIEPHIYLADSDRLIEHFADQNGVRPALLPVLSYYKQTILPQLLKLHQHG